MPSKDIEQRALAERRRRERYKQSGMEHVRCWVPAEYATWFRYAAHILRLRKKNKAEIELPEPVRNMKV